jgi:hypothetical protein
LILPDVYQAFKESAGRHDHRLAVVLNVQGGPNTINLAIPVQEFRGLGLPQVQVRFSLADPLHSELICLFVALGARRPNGRTFLEIKHPELQTSQVRGPGHFSPQGVYLASEVPFCKATDCRIAGHLTDCVSVDGQQQGLAAHPSSSQGGLDPGVAGSDHDHIIRLRINEHLAPQIRNT